MSQISPAAFDVGRNEFRTLAESAAWSAREKETALEPDIPIVDPHHHFWDRPDGRYLLDEFLGDARGGHDVIASVFVECGSMYAMGGPAEFEPVGETEFVVRTAEASDRRPDGQKCRVAQGIVGFADLMLGAGVDRVLQKHVAAARGRFKGIRYRCAWDEHGVGMHGKDPPRWRRGIMMDPQFRAGFARLAQFGLSYDAWQYYLQLAELHDLARAFPQTTIIVNHMGGPLGVGYYSTRKSEVFETWRNGLRELAALPNVCLKIGGMGMITYGHGLHLKDRPPSSSELVKVWAPFVETAIGIFGPERCMLESNFPVDQQSCAYGTLWNAFKVMTKAYTPSERHALFSGVASRTYRIAGDQ